ncbi:CAP domain-containing protein [uncultured Tateyamaria sp.]|uniref:CAP domain-containing protein n=1 Tax=uncultured Tateyamaria sp. TaxID=455651 RepID=UPI00262CD024|nr:CAP domain-containing protein [uncultured Tateyamaria sp.]
MSVANAFERQMLELINDERTSRGLDPLALELRLNDASEDHSVWMDDTRIFSHTGVGGSDPGDRMRDAGFAFEGQWTWGENIAYQPEQGAPGIADDVQDLHVSLMNSPGHRANILNPDFDLIGIGIEVGDNRGFDAVYVTQNFASTGASVQLDTGGGSGGGGGGNLTGTSGNDRLIGSGQNELLVGQGGNDRLFGAGGTDTVNGGPGNDRMWGGTQADLMRGGGGNDQMSGNAGNDRLEGADGRDRLNGDNGNDTAFGGGGADTLNGGRGNDLLFGIDGNDALRGDRGNDTLVGGDGNDRLEGGAGNDRMAGGNGADIFVFSNNRDVVVDFDGVQEQDRIDLRPASNITSFQDLRTDGHLRQVGDDVVISDGAGNNIRLLDVDIDSLLANDFIF